ncbi:MAG: DUF2808 domain-containing protein [Okeania sp. SIO3H1]|uniref:DUF2808 domain-containing protein n=1 Tax=Okeania sp. SIO1I7 TaxID=2607772 RepID=UPI0013C676B7|nr:DUF2808 domain-containing protein [Okeania sp. SIO1I7]NEN90159.1 DUF2808 domain-containing protein [Okeania sp. SIO3H1]NET28738.1 DUF2808 domain-containing protein [Okeania sp. SIO1I7]
MKRILSTLLVSSCLLTGVPIASLAQGMPGFTLFGGPEQKNQLNFRLDSGRSGTWDRYRLRIPANKLNLAVAQLSIFYPNYYKGTFDTEKIEIRVGGGSSKKPESIPIDEIVWDKENNFVEIYPAEPIPAGNKIEVVFSNVRNPRFGGMYHFNANIRTPGDVPLLRYIGTWLLTIE